MESLELLYPKNGKVLAPMVRAGTLPFRLLCCMYDADAVYAEELIDFKMLTTSRCVNGPYVDFVNLKKENSGPVFRTCELEKSKVIFQLGTADAVRATKVAELVQNDVAGFDINMGCPKHFSVQGGMGSALLRKPEVAEDILKSLRRNITKIPITCKIRLLDDDKSSVELVRRLENAGAMVIAVHCRETHHRPSQPAIWERLRVLSDAVQVPIVANGDLYSSEDHTKFLEMSGAKCGMFARGALKNASVFKKDGTLPLFDVMQNYANIAKVVGNHFQNTKYTLMQMLHYNSEKGIESVNAIVKKPKVQFEEILEALSISNDEMDTGNSLSWGSFQLPDESARPAKKQKKN